MEPSLGAAAKSIRGDAQRRSLGSFQGRLHRLEALACGDGSLRAGVRVDGGWTAPCEHPTLDERSMGCSLLGVPSGLGVRRGARTAGVCCRASRNQGRGSSFWNHRGRSGRWGDGTERSIGRRSSLPRAPEIHTPAGDRAHGAGCAHRRRRPVDASRPPRPAGRWGCDSGQQTRIGPSPRTRAGHGAHSGQSLRTLDRLIRLGSFGT